MTHQPVVRALEVSLIALRQFDPLALHRFHATLDVAQ